MRYQLFHLLTLDETLEKIRATAFPAGPENPGAWEKWIPLFSSEENSVTWHLDSLFDGDEFRNFRGVVTTVDNVLRKSVGGPRALDTSWRMEIEDLVKVSV